MMRAAAVSLVVCLLGAGAHAQGDLAEQVAELQREADDADPELIAAIARHGTRDAMQGLVKAYDSMASVYMRREILRALGRFDGIDEAEQGALERLAGVATGAKERELREEAIETLGKCEHLGPHYLRQIIRSEADDSVRELAMRAHVAKRGSADAELYRYIWNPQRERRKDAEGNVVGELEAIRELAFKGIAQDLGDDELVETVRDEAEPNPRIRRLALGELQRRRSPQAVEMADWVLGRVDFTGQDRAEAARILAAAQGPEVVKRFLALAKKRDVTPDDLRRTMADILVELDDATTNRTLMRLVGRGKPHDKVFALLATRHIDDPKLLKAIRKGLTDRDAEVRRAAAEALAARRDRDSVEDLESLLERPRDPSDVRVAIEALSEIRGRALAWLRRLDEFAKGEDRDVRNAAVDQLGQARDRKYLSTVLDAVAHDDWTTRLVAVRALQSWRIKEAIEPLIGRLAAETGRMRTCVADALWSLTGMPFDEDATRWRTWWEAEGEEFRVPSESDVVAAERERELQRLKQRTTSEAEFFGIRIISHRVIFVIDTSGSMTDPVHGRFVGKRIAARIDVAKEELKQCVENLDEGALFNIFAFSSGIGRWIKTGISGTAEHERAAALEWIDRLGAGGATNLFDTVKLAFDDPDVDTVVILSDGEPTAGEIIDPARIREQVKFWNRHRGIEIHTVAIGGDFEILEWLAEDSGGEHVRIR